MFLYSSPQFVISALEGVIALKLLYDRGFAIGGLGDLIDGFAGRFLEIMFGEDNIAWEKKDIDPPLEMATLNEDSDEYFMLEEYLKRTHFDLEIRIKELGAVDAQAKKKLMKTLQKLVPSEEEYDDGVFPWYEYFVSVSWLKEKNKIVGIKFHFADNVACCDEPPASILHRLKILVKFWDQLQEVRKSA